MMYRRHAAQHSAKSFENLAEKVEPNVGITQAFFAMMQKLGLFAQAERENRQFDRAAKRHRYHNAYKDAGLNGPRAVARRKRQIAAGSLKRENGLAA